MLVAYYLPEPMSARAQAALEGDEDPAISEFVELEFLSALSVRVRRRELSRSNATKVAALFSSHCSRGVFRTIKVDSRHFRLAKEIIRRFNLPVKAPDGLHLAVSMADQIDLVTADTQMARNGKALGIRTKLL